jgi:hypothetical protein
MANKPRYTASQMIVALKASKGLVYLAARRLGCDPETVLNYCRRFPTVEAAKVAARGELLDVAEAKLFLAVDRGEAWAISFALKTLGRHRGYGEQLDLHLTIHAAATRVARQMGVSVQEVLAEAETLLLEVDREA